MTTRDELRRLFLFESLDDQQLDWLLARGQVRTYDEGVTLAQQGDRAAHLFVLVRGAVVLSRTVRGRELVIATADHPGAYGGAIRAYVEPDAEYRETLRTTQPSAVFRLGALDFGDCVRAWFPMAVHLLDGLYVGTRLSEAQAHDLELIAGFSALSRRLVDDLNDPAVTATRAAAQLLDRSSQVRDIAVLAQAGLPASVYRELHALSDVLPTLADDQAAADRRTRHLAWLSDLGVPGAELVAASYASVPDDAWSVRVRNLGAALPGQVRRDALQWLAATVDVAVLSREVDEAATQISTLLALPETTGGDPIGAQPVDLTRTLDEALAAVTADLAGWRMRKRYDDRVAPLRCHADDLRAAWPLLLRAGAAAAARPGLLRISTEARGRSTDVVLSFGPEEVEGAPPDAAGRVDPHGVSAARRLLARSCAARLEADAWELGVRFSVTFASVNTS